MTISSNKVTFIAEAGVNHNGSLSRAIEMVDIAAECGADFVKFQTFTAEDLVSPNAPLAQYQQKNVKDLNNQFEMLKSLELSKGDFLTIKSHAEKNGMGFLSTPFSISSLDFLINSARVGLIKVSSGDLTYGQLMVEIGKSKLPIIISTGMSTIDEIENAIKFLKFGRAQNIGHIDDFIIPNDKFLQNFVPCEEINSWFEANLVVMHCTSEYPAPVESLNLLALTELKEKLNFKIGYSDHSTNLDVPIIAAALGAKYIEKHFTLSKDDKGPDHAASLEPIEMSELISRLREIPRIMGKKEKFCTDSEISNKQVVRRSIFAKTHIKQNEVFTQDNLVCLRPGDGISAFDFFNLIGKTSDSDLNAGDALNP